MSPTGLMLAIGCALLLVAIIVGIIVGPGGHR